MSTSSHASGVPEEEDAAPSVHDSAEVLPGECGDGHINEGEECDNGSDNSDVIPNTCRTSCRRPRCGDAVIDAGEQCDSGLNNSDLSPDRCRKTCILPYCGDGIVDTGEECDGDASCSNYCRRTVRESFCGNNLIETGEHCDDGNTFNGDGCSSLCRMEQAKAEETHAAAPNLVDVDTPALNTANPTSKDSLEPEQVEDSKKSVVAGTTFVSDVTASVIPTSARGAPVGDTGPAAMSVMIAGAAAGIGWIRRRKK
jgi:cysteine-rich repeat protein